MALKEKKITSANLMASVPLLFRSAAVATVGVSAQGTQEAEGERRMKCHHHRNASRFFPSVLLYTSSFILSLRFCIGVCFWVMHSSSSSSSSQMMYPALVQPPQEKKSEKEYVPYFGLCWPYTNTHKSRTTDVTVKFIFGKLQDIRACVCLPRDISTLFAPLSILFSLS